MGFSLGEVWRQFHERNIVWYLQAFCPVPASPVDDEHGMCPVRDSLCDLLEVQPHCLGVDVRRDQPCGGTPGGTSGTEDIAPLVTRITRCAGAGSAPRSFARKCSLLPNTGFILEPYLKGLPFACSGMSSTTRLAKFF